MDIRKLFHLFTIIILAIVGLLTLAGPPGEAMPIACAVPPPQSAACDTLNQEGIALYRQAQYRDAIQKFQDALACYREANDRKGEGTALNNIGSIYSRLGEYEQALDYYEQSLPIRREIGDRAGEGVSLNNIGGIYDSLGQYEEALDYYEQALTISREIGDRAGEGVSLNNIGGIYHRLGEYEEALDYYEQSLTIRREIGDRAGEGVSLNNIGLIYDSLGEYEEALDYYEQSLTIDREIGDRAGEGVSLNNIGLIYSRLGEYEEALDYYEQALTISRETGTRAGEGVRLNNIGLIYDHLGQYEEALDYYEQALTIRREIGDRAGEGGSLNSIGLIYSCLGEYEEALDYYEQSLTIRREIGDRAREGGSLNNIGFIYNSLGEYEEALDYYEQALTISREIGDRAGEGVSLNNIGSIYYRLGEYEEALDYYQQALTILREIGDRAGEGGSLNNIGGIYYRLGEYEEALDYYEQSLTIDCEIGDRAGEGGSLNNIGSIYDSLGEYAEALDYYEQAMTVLESMRATAGSEAGRASFIAQWAHLYDRAVNLYHTQEQDTWAFFTAERGRARAFLDSMATGHVQLSNNDDADLLAREQAAHAARRTAQVALSKARAQQPPDAALIADLETQLETANEEHAATRAAIEARGDQLAALTPGRSAVPELADVQALLDENGDTTLLSYWVLKDQTLAFLITPRQSSGQARDSFHTIALDVSKEDLIQQIRAFRQFPNLNVSHPESAVTLYNWLIAPLKDHLAAPSPRHLVIIPHNVLHYLPFAALTDGERYLIDDYAITYLPSAGVLRFIQENAAGRTPEPLLALGNPATADLNTTASLSTERDQLGPLPFAEQEARAIADLYATAPLIGAAATESIVRQQAGEIGVLHLAAHGHYNPVAPLQSLIALAPDGDNDGWLTAGEVYGLDLHQADLVVLSACQTQLGDLSAGDELVGLTRAFFYAGTPSVVASLWSVDDESTSSLMERFYTHLQEGTGKAEALRQAQIEMREEYPNPYYWSAFVLSGDGGGPGPVPTETPTPSGEDDSGGGVCPGAALPLTLAAIVGTLVTVRKTS